MLRLPRSIRVFAATAPIRGVTDVDQLVRRVRDGLGQDVFSGNLFCFFNRSRDRVKLLVWDRNGFWILTKRLERGSFESLGRVAPWIELTREELVMLIEGIDPKTCRFRRHFARDASTSPRDAGARSAHASE